MSGKLANLELISKIFILEIWNCISPIKHFAWNKINIDMKGILTKLAKLQYIWVYAGKYSMSQ